jgi:hypothetical protein
MKTILFVQDVDQSIQVMHNVGSWMEISGLQPSKWWNPANMNRKFLLQHADPNEFFVALVDGQPAASMVLQESERNQSWRTVDGEYSKTALYIH